MLMQNFEGTNKEYYGIFESGLFLNHYYLKLCLINVSINSCLEVKEILKVQWAIITQQLRYLMWYCANYISISFLIAEVATYFLFKSADC